MAQLVKHLTLAQVIISRFGSWSPASGSVLRAQSLELTSDSVSPPLSFPCSHCLPPSLSLKNFLIKKNKRKKYRLIPIRMLLSKKEKTPSVGEDVEKLEPLCTVAGNIK